MRRDYRYSGFRIFGTILVFIITPAQVMKPRSDSQSGAFLFYNKKIHKYLRFDFVRVSLYQQKSKVCILEK